MFGRREFGLRFAALVGGLAAVLYAAAPAALAQANVTVFAAASLKNALDAVNAAWKAETGKKAAISYAASSALAKQIEEAAPADVFISADLDWMDYLSERNLIKTDTEVRAARQPHRAGRAGRFRRRGRDRAGLRPCRPARRRPARHGERRRGAGRQIRQGGARDARRLGQRRGQGGAGRERARRAGARLDRRGAARHRLPDRRRRRSGGEDRRHVPGGHAPADHLSRGRDRRRDQRRRGGLPRVPADAKAAADCSRRRGSPCWLPSW